MELLKDLEYMPLTKRGITQETAELFRYGVTRHRDEWVQVAQYRDESGTPVAQHIRGAGKSFSWRGESKDALPLWGMGLWRDNGRKVVITEGEVDAMSVSQAQGNKWPVVSVPNGAQGAKRDVAKALQWLLKFDEVIIWFDMDEPGRKAAAEVASLLPPGRAKVVSIEGYKDANEMLVAGDTSGIVSAIFGAREHRPDGIVSLNDVIDEATKPVEWGVDWPWATLTKLTYGRRKGELYALGAGTGVGKSDVFSECIAHDNSMGIPVAVFAFEATPAETARRVAGKHANRTFHIPDTGWNAGELRDSLEHLQDCAPLYLYDSWGATDYDTVETTIEWLVQAQGVQHVYIDHLTAFAAADAANERTVLEDVMARLAKLTKRLQIVCHFVSHLATPDGTPHEEGGRVSIRHFKGSRAIGFWSHFMFGLERSQQAEDETERHTTTFRVLKDRYTGRATGETFPLYYTEHGRLTEEAPQSDPFGDDAEDCPF